MGIIDRTPVDHSLRPQNSTYSAAAELAAMRRYLAGRPHMAQPSAAAGLAHIHATLLAASAEPHEPHHDDAPGAPMAPSNAPITAEPLA